MNFCEEIFGLDFESIGHNEVREAIPGTEARIFNWPPAPRPCAWQRRGVDAAGLTLLGLTVARCVWEYYCHDRR